MGDTPALPGPTVTRELVRTHAASQTRSSSGSLPEGPWFKSKPRNQFDVNAQRVKPLAFSGLIAFLARFL
jgi:hypothetical protein